MDCQMWKHIDFIKLLNGRLTSVKEHEMTEHINGCFKCIIHYMRIVDLLKEANSYNKMVDLSSIMAVRVND